MAERRGSSGERGWGGPGCQEWGFVDMVMSLLCVCVSVSVCVCVCVCVRVCVFRCLLHLTGPLVFVLLFRVVSFLCLSVSQVAICADAEEVLLSDGNEKSIQSILSSSSLLPLPSISPISASFLHLTFIYMHSNEMASGSTCVFSSGVLNSGFVTCAAVFDMSQH